MGLDSFIDCPYCEARASTYLNSCMGCLHRSVSRLPKVIRLEVYQEVQRLKGDPALQKFKDRVKREWYLDHPEQQQPKEAA